MPSYNSSKFIKYSINSVINQTYKNWELIIVDDNSADDTWKIISEYSKENKSIKTYKLRKNKGASYARNYAIKKSVGQYIAFLDSDDIWLPNKLLFQHKIFQEINAPIIFSNYYVRRDNHKEYKNIIKSNNKIYFKDILKTNSICTSTAVYDTFLIGKKYMPNLYQRHDWALWMIILGLKKDYFAFCIEEPLAIRVQHQNALSSNIPRSLYFNYLALRIYGGLEKKKALMRVLKNIFRVILKRIKPYFKF